MALTKTGDALAETTARRPRRFRLSSITRASRFYWVRMLLENPAAVVSLGFVAVILLLALFASVIAPYDPNYVDPGIRLQGPSSGHLFGTDALGRDVFSRAIYGTRISLLVGMAVTAGAVSIGSLIGLIAGYYRRIDMPLMRFMDGFEAFPSILLAIAIMATLGPATRNVIIALSVVYAPNISRLVRSLTLVNKSELYVESARAIGMRDFAILRRYIFMNSLSPLIVQATFVVAFAILAEASLSYLGAGVPPGIATWGNMVSEGQAQLQRAWWIAVFPGTFLFLTVLAMNLVGDGMRDALDPRARDR